MIWTNKQKPFSLSLLSFQYSICSHMAYLIPLSPTQSPLRWNRIEHWERYHWFPSKIVKKNMTFTSKILPSLCLKKKNLKRIILVIWKNNWYYSVDSWPVCCSYYLVLMVGQRTTCFHMNGVHEKTNRFRIRNLLPFPVQLIHSPYRRKHDAYCHRFWHWVHLHKEPPFPVLLEMQS